MKLKTKPNIFLIAAGILFCLVLVSVHFSAGMYARYTTRAEGSDAGRLAAFRVSAEAGENQTLELTAGREEAASYQFKVQNSSETAVRYDVILEFPESGKDIDKDRLNIKLDGTKEPDVQGKEARFSGVGVLAPGSEAVNHKLTVDISGLLDQAENKWEDFSNDSVSGETGELPFTVRVVFTQVD